MDTGVARGHVPLQAKPGNAVGVVFFQGQDIGELAVGWLGVVQAAAALGGLAEDTLSRGFCLCIIQDVEQGDRTTVSRYPASGGTHRRIREYNEA